VSNKPNSKKPSSKPDDKIQRFAEILAQAAVRAQEEGQRAEIISAMSGIIVVLMNQLDRTHAHLTVKEIAEYRQGVELSFDPEIQTFCIRLVDARSISPKVQ
jgi:hypothetical protein